MKLPLLYNNRSCRILGLVVSKKKSQKNAKLSSFGRSEARDCDGLAWRCVKNILIFRAEVKPVVTPVRIAINGDRCGMHNAYRRELRAYLRKKLICVLVHPAADFGHKWNNDKSTMIIIRMN